jgi:hypothetical protein
MKRLAVASPLGRVGGVMKRLAVASLAVGLLAARAGAAEPVGLVPTLGTQTGLISERLQVSAGDLSLSETRSLWVTRLALGLEYALPGAPATEALRGHTSVGVGLVYASGQWPVQVRQEVSWTRPITSWLSVDVGLGTSLHLNPSSFHLSYWDLGAPVALDIAGVVELVYYPALVVALGASREPAFGGEKTHGIATGLALFELGLRVRFGGLGF